MEIINGPDILFNIATPPSMHFAYLTTCVQWEASQHALLLSAPLFHWAPADLSTTITVGVHYILLKLIGDATHMHDKNSRMKLP